MQLKMTQTPKFAKVKLFNFGLKVSLIVARGILLLPTIVCIHAPIFYHFNFTSQWANNCLNCFSTDGFWCPWFTPG